MKRTIRNRSRFAQRGQAFLLLVITLVMGAAAIFYGLSSATPPEIERDRKTAKALAIAKAALIGYAVGVSNFAGNDRPGDLPCPDLNDSSITGSPNCNAQASRLGRLPWKSLGLPDLRDGDGERLWYAVSNNFKSSTRTACTSSDDADCLNSDTRGAITVRDSASNVVNDGSNPDPYTPSGVIAIVIAPGAVLKRQGAAAQQNRTCTGGACTAAGVCTTSPATNTPKCNPSNYLDTVSGVEDNAGFTDGSATDGFINGIARDTAGNIVVNDRLITITYQDLMPLLEYRVAMETLYCLRSYAAANGGRYPWANMVTNSSKNDDEGALFGRLANSLNKTKATASTMDNSWPNTGLSPCSRTQGSWWQNWEDYVFYAIGDAYKPDSGTPSGCGAPGSCVTLNPPSATPDKQVVVLVSGKSLAGQFRTTNSQRHTTENFLEGENNNSDSLFTKLSKSTTFNDTVVFYPP